MGAPPTSHHRVAVVIEASNSYARGLLSGIQHYLLEHERWNIFLTEHGRGEPPLDLLARWRGDGVIARVETREIAKAVGRMHRAGTSVVDVSAARLIPRVPYVETDDAAIAAAAAEHFVERDFRNFAFLGDARFRWSDNRCRGFVAAVRARGREVEIFRPATAGRHATRRARMAGARDDEAVEAWLVGLPKPVAVFACYDSRGRQAVEACHRAGLVVPDEVAVLGVNDDELLCRFSSPPLSSVIPDAVGAGRVAAELLDRLMRGQPLERDEWLLPPLGISTRQSSDILVIDDELVVAAVRYIRENACRGIGTADVTRAVGASRRTLEHRFSNRIGHTPHEEILRVVFRRVDQLLLETDLPLSVIAERCGFRHAEYMTVAFTRRHGLPPSRWRAAHGGRSGPRTVSGATARRRS